VSTRDYATDERREEDAERGHVAPRALVAEDEFVIALEIEDSLRRAGYEVVGPVATADEATRLAAEERLDAAVLDIELRDGRAFPAADALVRRGVPFVFLTGYEPLMLPERLRGRPLLAKPHATARLPAVLAAAVWEQRVRGRAYAIWQREGRPEGGADRHWSSAEAELQAEAERDTPSARERPYRP
jgi:CheY-like chemotaxis protein